MSLTTPMHTPRRPEVTVVDWGIGGLATFAGLAERLPGVELRYLSDSGFTPWGKVEADALAERISLLTAPHLAAGDLLVLACNAASTVVDRLSLPAGVEVADVIGPGVALLDREARRGRRRLAVLGGARTIASGAHRRALGQQLAPELWPMEAGDIDGVSLLELVAQPLSAHVEAGRLDGLELLADLRPLIHTLLSAGTEVALLACTHYPALGPVLAREAPSIVWLDPVADPVGGLVAGLSRRLVGRDAAVNADAVPAPGAARTVTTTGDPEKMREAALAAFGLALPEVRRAP